MEKITRETSTSSPSLLSPYDQTVARNKAGHKFKTRMEASHNLHSSNNNRCMGRGEKLNVRAGNISGSGFICCPCLQLKSQLAGLKETRRWLLHLISVLPKPISHNGDSQFALISCKRLRQKTERLN